MAMVNCLGYNTPGEHWNPSKRMGIRAGAAPGSGWPTAQETFRWAGTETGAGMRGDQASYAERKGKEGERFFRAYATRHGIPYLPIDQSLETMPPYLSRIGGKRPNVVAVAAHDHILIEIKNKRTQSHGAHNYVTLTREEAAELGRTERALGKRVLLAYRLESEHGAWYGRYLSDSVSDHTTLELTGRFGPYYAFRVDRFRPMFDFVHGEAGTGGKADEREVPLSELQRQLFN